MSFIKITLRQGYQLWVLFEGVEAIVGRSAARGRRLYDGLAGRKVFFIYWLCHFQTHVPCYSIVTNSLLLGQTIMLETKYPSKEIIVLF